MRRASLHCQVEGCTADLSALRAYFQRQHICEEHARAHEIPTAHHGPVRFCQQCTKLEPLSAFDGTKRSCVTSLVKRHHRRSGGSKRAYAAIASSGAARSGSSGGGGGGSVRGARAVSQRPADTEDERSEASQLTGEPSASGGMQADMAARSLAALVDAALPSGDPADTVAAASASAAAAEPPPADLGLSVAFDARGSGILGRLQPVRPAAAHAPLPPSNLGFNLSTVASGLPPVATWPVPPGSVAHSVHAQRATFPPAPLALHSSSTSSQDLLPTLASVLSSRTTAGVAVSRPQGSRLAPAAQQAAAGGGGGGDEHGELRDLLSALEQLQRLQSLISQVVLAQMQQHQARTEAAALLERQLLPLLSAIQEQLQPSGESSGQVAQLLSSLRQLAGMLTPPPPPADQQALHLLQWLQTSGALGDMPSHSSGAPPPPAAPAPKQPAPPVVEQQAPPQHAVRQVPAPSAAAVAAVQATPAPDKQQLQAMLERVSGLLKRQEASGM